MFLGGSGGDMAYYSGGNSYSDHIFRTLQGGSQIERFRIGASGDIGLSGENYGTSGQVLTSQGSGSAATWTTISGGGVTVQDEGSALSTTATTLNFVGSGVVASGTGATKTITIAGGTSQNVFPNYCSFWSE